MRHIFKNDKGIALGYIYGLVALLAILGAMIAQDSGVTQSAIKQKQMADSLVGQASLIRNALFLCKVSYPGGGATGGTDNSLPATTTDLANATCPGTSGEKIFGGVSDILYPPPIDRFGDWSLTNDGTGVKIAITRTSTTDKNSEVAMSLAAQEIGSFQATATASTLTVIIKQ